MRARAEALGGKVLFESKTLEAEGYANDLLPKARGQCVFLAMPISVPI